ncbi:MAG: VWA domain-containing protein [Desulfosalsimonadaceae bacterium]
MLNLILNFVCACRASDLRVSTTEVMDCARHLEMVDVLDEAQFRSTLRANFAKSRREQSEFDRLYGLFFHDMRLDVELDADCDPENTDKADMRETIAQMRREAGDDEITKAIMDFLAGDPIPYLRQMQRLETQTEESSQALKSNLSQLSSRLEVMLRINRTRNRLLQLLPDPTPGGAPGRNRGMARLLMERLETANRMLTQETRPNNDALKQVNTYEKRTIGIGERPFSNLTEIEIVKMRSVIDQLVRKMKDIMSRRYAARNRGALDVKKTLRAAQRYQGVPIEIVFRQRPLRKTRVVTLCDVSGSVWSAARFMLNMIYSMQDCFSDVKSFAFVAGPTNITDIFEKHDVNQAIEKVITDADINFNAHTDYGEMLTQFHLNHLNLLSKKTTLIIVGDARTNYQNPCEHLLDDMRARCRRVIWLNPEPEQFWGTGDSEMNTYKAYCHEVRPCRNLNQLVNFIEDLVF